MPQTVTDLPPADPGIGNLLGGYLLLGVQPLPVGILAGLGWAAADSVFARFSFSAICIISICLIRRRGLITKNWPMLILRGVLGGSAVLLYFTSIEHAGAARGTLLNYTYPLWANLFAHFMGKRASRGFWAALLVAFFGTVLIVMPPGGFGSARIGQGELAALASAILAGGAVLTMKKLRETDESLTIIAAFTVFGLLMSAPLADIPNALASLTDIHTLWAALAVGALSFLGHVLFTRGYRGASVQQATLLSLLVPIIAAALGVLILDEAFTLQFACGGLLVIGALATAMTAQAVNLRENLRKSRT